MPLFAYLNITFQKTCKKKKKRFEIPNVINQLGMYDNY